MHNLSPIDENEDVPTKKYVDDKVQTSNEVHIGPTQPNPPTEIWVNTSTPSAVDNYVKKTGDTMSGDLIFDDPQDEGNEIRFTDFGMINWANNGVMLTSFGDFLTVQDDVDFKNIVIADPTADAHAATKKYVDSLGSVTTGLVTTSGIWVITLNRLYKKNGWVVMNLGTSKNAVGSIETVGTLPTGFRPPGEFSCLVQSSAIATGGGYKIYAGTIDASGLVRLRGSTFPAANEGLTFIASWPLA